MAKEKEKLDLTSIVRDFSTNMTAIVAGMDAQVALYFDNGFNSGGSNEIVDADIEAAGITAADLGDMINFMQQLSTWLNNGVPLQGNWSANLNKTRNVRL